MDMSQYLDIFIEESKEHVQHLNENLLELEKSPHDMGTLNEIFRAAHTLKGIAGTMGFTRMATLTHDMENVLSTIRSGELSVSTKLVDVLFKCLDALENYLTEIVNTGLEGDKEYKEIIQELKDINSSKGEQSKPLKANEISNDSGETKESSLGAVLFGDSSTKQVDIEKKDTTETLAGVINNEKLEEGEIPIKEIKGERYKITVRLSQSCLLKSARSFIVFQTVEKHSEIIDSIPSIHDIEEERFDTQFSLIIATNESIEKITSDINKISEIEEVLCEKIISSQTIITNNVTKPKIEPQKTQVIEEVKLKREVKQEVTEIKQNDSSKQTSEKDEKPRMAKTVRVDIGRLDNLMNLVSELIIIKTTLEDNATTEKFEDYKESIEYLERITTNLHDAVMKVRMVPVENVFNRFPRMIRDLAKELGKEIILNMSGEETEVDRTVIDELGDPLIHLLRNSADHGIEDPEIRANLGKPKTGTIDLRSYHDGNNVVIEVEDDGKGIDAEKIKKKIVEKGLASEEEVSLMEKSELISYLFKPSFSTADKITDVSGRGVGLDVVKTKIAALGGEILVETEVNKKCRFIIRLPLTLAIIQALLVIIGEEKYAIPLNSIKEIINITEDQIKSVQNQEVYMLRNQVIPVIRLDKKLSVPKNNTNTKSELTIVIVKKGDRLSGFLVDELMGQQEIVIKSLGKYLNVIKSIAGATILGDGQVALILDVNSLT